MQLKLNNKLIIVFISLFASGIFTVVFMGSHHSRENMEPKIPVNFIPTTVLLTQMLYILPFVPLLTDIKFDFH